MARKWRVGRLCTKKDKDMATVYIPSEEDIKRWIQEAVNDALSAAFKQQTANPDEPLLTRKEMAKVLNISLVTLNDWVKRGLPVHKNRGRVYFLRSEVMAYLNVKRG